MDEDEARKALDDVTYEQILEWRPDLVKIFTKESHSRSAWSAAALHEVMTLLTDATRIAMSVEMCEQFARIDPELERKLHDRWPDGTGLDRESERLLREEGSGSVGEGKRDDEIDSMDLEDLLHDADLEGDVSLDTRDTLRPEARRSELAIERGAREDDDESWREQVEDDDDE